MAPRGGTREVARRNRNTLDDGDLLAFLVAATKVAVARYYGSWFAIRHLPSTSIVEHSTASGAPVGAPDRCTPCTLEPSRRAFVRAATTAVAAALASLGALPAVADALPVMAVRGVRWRGVVRYPIPAADSVLIDRDNEVILARWQGQVIAFSLACPHQNTTLRWNDAEKRFQCPKHKSQYTPTGGFIDGRATRGMDRLAIKKDGAQVVVDPEQLFKEDENAAEWTAAVVAV